MRLLLQRGLTFTSNVAQESFRSSSYLGRARGRSRSQACERRSSLSSHCFYLNWKLDQRLWHAAPHPPPTRSPSQLRSLISRLGVCLSALLVVVFPAAKKKTARPHQETRRPVLCLPDRLAFCAAADDNYFFIRGRRLCFRSQTSFELHQVSIEVWPFIL